MNKHTSVPDLPPVYKHIRCLSATANFIICVFITFGIIYAVKLIFNATPFITNGIDDANIFMVYGRHFRLGAGFVYNIGGERVEGFTSLLWVLFCAFAFFFNNPEQVLLIINIALIAIVLCSLILRLNHLFGAKISLSAIAVLAWTFTAPEYISWTVTTLMETGLWSSLLILALLSLSASVCNNKIGRIFFPVFIALMLLTRPEAIAWGIGFCGLAFLFSLLKSGKIGHALRQTLPALISYIGTLSCLTLFRLTYFGYPLPNTYYAKVSPDKAYSLQEGWHYFLAFLETNGWIPYLLAAAILVFAALSVTGIVLIAKKKKDLEIKEKHFFAYAVSASIIVGMLIPIQVGGDHFASFRFYQPIWPLLPIPLFYIANLLGTKILRATPKHLRYILPTLVRIAAIFVLTKSFTNSNNADWGNIEKTKLYINFANANDGRLFGQNMNRLFAGMDKPSLGAITAGGFKLAYEGPVIDLMGLNNVAMAHSPGNRKGIKNHAAFNKDVFFKLKPDIMPLTELTPDQIGPELRWEHPQVQRCVQHRWSRVPLKDLYFEPAFHDNYTLAYITRAEKPAETGLLAFIRNDYYQKTAKTDVLRIQKGTGMPR